MKTQEEIVIQAKAYAESIGNEDGTSAYDYVMGYTQCQQDNADKKYTIKEVERYHYIRATQGIKSAYNYIQSLNKQD